MSAMKKRPRSPTAIIPPAGGVNLAAMLGAAMETPPPEESCGKLGRKVRKRKRRKR